LSEPAVPRILFVDPDHGPRSQMAEALLGQVAAGHFDIGSAGTDPRGRLDGVASVLAEVGITGFVATRRPITSVLEPPPDLLVSVCEEGCGSCPYVPGSRHVERWAQPDPGQAPEDQRLETLRGIRDDLRRRIRELLEHPPA
jgi:protein-tyrosine-phosphatase